MLRQRLARNTMGESLVNSVVVSMLRTDYIRSFNMPDTVASHVKFTVLHVYPVVARLKRYPTKEVSDSPNPVGRRSLLMLGGGKADFGKRGKLLPFFLEFAKKSVGQSLPKFAKVCQK